MKLKETQPTNEKNNNETIRFTTLINPTLLSNIKLISYFTNQKLYETINNSIQHYIDDFEIKNNISIKSIINLQNNFSNNNIIDNKEDIKEDIKEETSNKK